MYSFKILNCFKKQLKSLVKKFPSLKSDVIAALHSFHKETSISLGNNNYKIRILSSDLKRGKSKSFRLILHVIEIENLLLPIALYYKGEKGNISKKRIIDHVHTAFEEFENMDKNTHL